VHFTHTKYLACADDSRDGSRPSGIGTEEVEDTRVIIHNLHPHSEYEFEVVAVTTNSEKPEFLKTVADTLEAAPEVRALPRQSADSSTHIKMAVFDWTRPAESQCSLYNSHLGGWAYKVVGMDDWNKQFMMQGNLPISQTHLEVENLAPYSQYLLLLYTANQAGLYDENVVLKIPVTTAQSNPAAPSQLQAVQASPGSVMLNWETVFPPLGDVSSYGVRWKEEDSTTWTEVRAVPRSDTVCEGAGYDACYLLSNLTDSKTYSFQVQTFHSGNSQGSDWSSIISLDTQEQGTTTSYVFIVLGCLPILGIIVFILVTKYRKKQGTVGKQKHSVVYKSQDPELLTPIIKNSNNLTLPKQSTPGSGSPRMFTTLPTHRPRSHCDPLPPLPSKDNHIYEAVKNNDNEVLCDEDEYLAPNPLRVESKESLDEEGYLRPNFVPVPS